jgi:hypothetical protein
MLMSEGEIVQVTHQSFAYSRPNFVIEQDGRLYVTLAVLEYDPKAEDLSAEQKRGVKQMQELFEGAYKQGSVRAAKLEAGWEDLGPLNSGPLNSGQFPPRPRKK